MRFSFLSMGVSVLLVPCGQSQSVSPAKVVTGTSAELPMMPTPKQAAVDGGSEAIPPYLLNLRVELKPPLATRIREGRVVDKKFLLIAGSAMGTSLLVVAATRHCRRTVGVNSCIGGDGEFSAIQGVQISLSGVLATVGYFWKRSDHETHTNSEWWLFPVAISTFDALLAKTQYDKHCPSGTIFDGRNCK